MVVARRLLMGGGGSFTSPEENVMRSTSVKRTSNVSTPFDYYDATPPSGTATNNGVVEFDTEIYDDDGLWVIGSPTKFGPMPSSHNGKRAVFYACGIWTNDTTYAELKIFRNGALDLPVAVKQDTSNAFNTGVELTSRPIVLATGDYFELCVKSGDAATCLYAEDYSITFAIEVRF